jgi:hypothetical protein
LAAAEMVITHRPPTGINDDDDSLIPASPGYVVGRPPLAPNGYCMGTPTTTQLDARSIHGVTDVLYPYGFSVFDLASAGVDVHAYATTSWAGPGQGIAGYTMPERE